MDRCSRCRKVIILLDFLYQELTSIWNRGKSCMFNFVLLFFFGLCYVIVQLETGQIKLITLALINSTCSYFLLAVCVTKQRPPVSNNAGIVSSVSPPHLFFVPFKRFCMSKSLIQAAKGVIFHFHSDIFQDWGELL